MSDLVTVLAAGAVTALAALLVTLAVALRIGRHSVVDVTWGAGFAAVAVAGLLVSPGAGDGTRRALAVVLTCVWGLRLAIHIAWRQRGGGEDPRYEAMLAGRSTAAAFRSVYLTQAAALWFVAIPVQAALVLGGPVGPLAWIGVAVWAAGFAFEAVGDLQLARFRADPAHHGRVLDTGLWAWTRHPNYFGDACVWWGLFLLAADRPAGWLTVLSPVLMTWLLASKTGKPLMERHLAERRPGYAAYVARTSGFVPRPPRAG